MRKFGFVSRHKATEEQIRMAESFGVELVQLPDCDAFRDWPDGTIARGQPAAFAGYVVVHPAIALRMLSLGFEIGVFENGTRPGPDQKPQFYPVAFHIFKAAKPDDKPEAFPMTHNGQEIK